MSQPNLPKMTTKTLIGNSAEILRNLPDGSVDCCVTSPPYWGLRDYKTPPQLWGGRLECDHRCQPTKRPGGNGDGTSFRRDDEGNYNHGENEPGFCSMCGGWMGQLGLEPSPELFIEHLCMIFDEVRRVLKPSGTCWIVIGDTYSGSWGNYGSREGGQRSKSTEVIHRPGATPNTMRPPMAKCSVPRKSLIQIPSRFAIEMVSRGWILRNELIWEKPNCMPDGGHDRFLVNFEKLYFFAKTENYYFEQQREGRKVRRSVWKVNTQPSRVNHTAAFPPQLIATPIRAGCPPRGVVLDPFAGTGTTGLVATKLGRSSIMIELNPAYLQDGNDQTMLLELSDFEAAAPKEVAL
jgi:site-specific DNA-methyltransferase (cytosine-N4-specific)